MLFLLVATYAFIEFRGIFPKGTDSRELMKLTHFTLGFSIFMLTFIRFFYRTRSQNMRAIESSHRLARYGHLVFYGFMLIMPILGWLTLNAEGKDLVIFTVEFPTLISKNEALAELFEESHELIGKLGYVLITMHVLAACIHQFIKRDNTLNKMT